MILLRKYFETSPTIFPIVCGCLLSSLRRTYQVIGEDKILLSTESCNCPKVQHSLDGGWKRAEHTAHEIMSDLNSWAQGW